MDQPTPMDQPIPGNQSTPGDQPAPEESKKPESKKPQSKKALIVLAVIGVLAAFVILSPGTWQKTEPTPSLREGQPVPDFALKAPGGNVWRLSERRGSVVILNFWATWCPPCKEELPSLQNLRNLKKGNKDFEIMTILYRDNPHRAFKFLKDNDLDLPFLNDEASEVSRLYHITAIPESFIIDKKGVLRKLIKGPTVFDSDENVQFVTKLLQE